MLNLRVNIKRVAVALALTSISVASGSQTMAEGSEFRVDNDVLIDKAVPKIQAMTNLDKLYLTNSPLTDKQLAKLVSLKNLSSLDLSDTKVTAATFPEFSKLDDLRLDGCPLNGKGIDTILHHCRNLSWLSLQGTPVSDADVQPLIYLNDLKYLNLKRTKTTKSGIDKMRLDLPDCRIDR